MISDTKLKQRNTEFKCSLLVSIFQGELLFFVNGECQGVASKNLPSMVYAVVDMYGKCAQITLTSPSTPDSSKLCTNYLHMIKNTRL